MCIRDSVNAEHQSKIVELVELNNDLDNLITSTRIATLFLDENMIIRRFTPGIKRIFKMLDGDVGRPVSHLLHTLADVEPYQLARAVMRGDGEQEREVHTEDGAWFLMRVLPYHVSAETVSGVVLTFTDISLLKMAREALSERETRLTSLYRAVPVGVGRIAKRVFLEANRQLCQMLGYDSEELIGRSTRVLYLSDDAFESAGKDFYGRIQEQGAGTVETRWRRRDGMVVPVLISGSVLDPENPDDGVTFAVLDLSDRESALAKLRESERVAHAALDALTAHIAILDETGTILTVNRAWRKFALKNGGALDQVAEGVNYLEVCDRAQGDEAGDAAAFAAGIRAVLRGDCQRFVYGYPCHSASEQRCFVGRAIRLPGEGPTRVVVAHELSRAGPAENGGLP
ncbi:MAG TPA: hypothetical protein DIC59_02480 [Candidatus Competibacteraceae bacterium]|nr:hypothetical protein [Candidatus Competibacteraceae bacterium]